MSQVRKPLVPDTQFEKTGFVTLLDEKVMFYVHNPAAAAAQGDILLMHGLGSSPYDYAYHVAARRWQAAGWNVWRPAFYWWEEGCRRTADSCMADWQADMLALAEEKQLKKLMVVGHSFGGLQALMWAKVYPETQALSLWDCSYNSAGWTAYLREKNGVTYFNSGISTVVSDTLMVEMVKLDSVACEKLASEINVPTQVVIAGLGILQESGNTYFKALTGEKEKVLLGDSGHCWWENDSAEQVADRTLGWFEKARN